MNRLHDHNGWAGHWPFRDLGSFGSLDHFRRQMAECGVGSASVSPLEGLYRVESESANERLAQEIAGDPAFRLVPIFQPPSDYSRAALSRWEGTGTLRLAPSFHSYSLLEPRSLEFIAEAIARGWEIAITVRLVDERSQPPAFPIPPVPVEEVVELARRFPGGSLLACGLRVTEVKQHSAGLQECPRLKIDLSHLDGGYGLEAAAELLGPDRLLYGSNYPLFYMQAAVAKEALLERDDGDR